MPSRDWPHRAYVWFERTVLSAGMTVLALVVERILVRAIRKGGVEPAPRTAAGPSELSSNGGVDERAAQVGPSRPPVHRF
jgi:hypothetical protein